jgi:hypothetical protein
VVWAWFEIKWEDFGVGFADEVKNCEIGWGVWRCGYFGERCVDWTWITEEAENK